MQSEEVLMDLAPSIKLAGQEVVHGFSGNTPEFECKEGVTNK